MSKDLMLLQCPLCKEVWTTDAAELDCCDCNCKPVIKSLSELILEEPDDEPGDHWDEDDEYNEW